MKRNAACCIARGSIIAHFDEGCLYAPDYLSRLAAELAAPSSAGGFGRLPPSAVSLSKWYTYSIAETEFRLVDLKKPEPLWESYGLNARTGQEVDQFNHGFVYGFARSAWEQQPFPDRETLCGGDGAFVRALQSQNVPVKL